MPDWKALKHIQLNAFEQSRAIWDDPVDIEIINGAEFEDIRYRIDLMKRRGARQNVLIEGTAGTGKSHLLGRVRRHVLRSRDVFIAAHLSRAETFWSELAVAYGTALEKPTGNSETQRANIVRGLLARLDVTDKTVEAIMNGEVSDATLQDLAPYWARLLGSDPNGMRARNVAQGLLLMQSDDFEHREIAGIILNGLALDDVERKAFGLSRLDADARQVVLAHDRLIGESRLASVLGIDQLDALVANAKRMLDDNGRTELNKVSTALMDLANDLQSTLVVLSCLIDTWKLIEDEAISSAPDRFPIRNRLGMLPSADAGRALISSLLAEEFNHRAISPPTETWPFRPEAFRTAPEYTARGLIQQVNERLAELQNAAQPAEIANLEANSSDRSPTPDSALSPDPTLNPAVTDHHFVDLDNRFEAYRAEAKFLELDQDNADFIFPELLAGALRAFAIENDDLGEFTVDTVLESNPAVHGRLRYIVDAALEDEVHWCYRVLLHDHYRAQQSRLQKANVASGLGPRRGLAILRNANFHPGKKTQALVQELRDRGGRISPLDENDLRTFEALTYMAKDAPERFEDWLHSRRPASATALLEPILAHSELPQTGGVPASEKEAASVPARQQTAAMVDASKPSSFEAAGSEGGRGGAPNKAEPVADQASLPRRIIVGVSPRNGSAVSLPVPDLKIHAAIFAGSGSGKTVLLRRIVEEAALAGISSIVLDPNNDLARLGSPWPTPPESWQQGDADKAREFFRTVETVVWTPRISSGRPLSFAPLAGLPDIVGDQDEFNVALDTVVGLMAPRANLTATSSKGKQGRAVLKQALEHYVRAGGDKLGPFLDFLNDLPDHVSDLAQSDKLSREIAQTLKAEMVNDPMFSDRGQAIDPSALLTPSAGMRARISVISLIGLPGEEQRQPFVSQLQMALFAWAKKNPAGERPLNGLFVMDEAQTFAPSGAITPSTNSTLALASQARKYGLGLLFATQAPKGIHNQITGNTGTQIFGRLVAANQVATARDLAAAKGGTIADISRLKSGEFYIGSVNVRFQRLDSPMCLSYHPSSPLAENEIVALAARADEKV